MSFIVYILVPPGHPRDFKVKAHVLYGTKIELEFSWKPPSTGDPVHTYWIECNRTAADGSPLNPRSIRIVLPLLHLKTRINADPYIAYHCHSYASNNVSSGPFSRTVSIQPIPLGKYFILYFIKHYF